MRTAAILAAAGLVSWLLRVLLVTVVPASRLPDGLRTVLEHGGVAVPMALVATGLARAHGLPALVVPSPTLVALVVAGVLAWRTRQLAVAMPGAVVAFWVLEPAWGAFGG